MRKTLFATKQNQRSLQAARRLNCKNINEKKKRQRQTSADDSSGCFWLTSLCKNSRVNISMWSETNLRRQFHFQLPRQILPLELCVLADVRGDHPLDLLGLKQQTQAEVVHAEGKQTQTQTVKQKSSEDVRRYKSSPLFRFLAAFEQIIQTVREQNIDSHFQDR